MRTIEWIFVIFNIVMLIGFFGARNMSHGMLWGGFTG